MRIYLTYDYELFFGEESGTVEKCMLQPTGDLFKIAKDKDVFYTFFVDVGYLVAAENYPELKEEHSLVKEQIKKMIKLGHDVQLHIHPHWEKAVYQNGKWDMNVDGHYKFSDFEEKERKDLFKKYKAYLDELIGRSTIAYRAGGWCIQPFSIFKESFESTGIKIDSSVIAGDYMQTDNYALDFRDAPLKSSYRFEDDVCHEDENGQFMELPISSLRYSPLFFWQLYIKGRIKPADHKMIGDGTFISQGGRKKRVLTSYTTNHVSTDGYFAKKLNAGLNKAINLKQEEMVVIGHPKGNTTYSLKKLAEFIDEHHKNHQFTTFHKEF